MNGRPFLLLHRCAHAFRDHANARHACAFRRVDHVNDTPIGQRAIGRDEKRFVASIAKGVGEGGLELIERDWLLVDRDMAVGRILENDAQ